MNKEQILEMKKAYENALVIQLAQALGMEESKVTAEWSLEQTVINIVQGDEIATNTYTLTAKDNNLLLTMMGCKIHKSNNVIIAYEVMPMSIDIATFNALNALIMNILNSDPLSASAPVEEVNE
jgi:hypothetical protein